MSMTIRRPLDFNDAGAGDDEPVKGVLQGHIREWHDELDRLTRQLAEAQGVIETLVADIEDYERVNNLAPSPGKPDCWQSVTRAKAVLSQSAAMGTTE
jgi:hypothetical protein